ncbi:hypothetical protein [Nostoc sp.]|uniref:hypothetical protein n=1 Tax=Nostoc sp. TaxID=1180 RepID=UPI002FF472AA
MANDEQISKYAQLVAVLSNLLSQSKVIGSKAGDLITNVAATVAAFFTDNSRRKP